MKIVIAISTLIFAAITLAFLTWDHVHSYREARTNFSIIISGIKIDSKMSVVKIALMVINHSSQPISIIDIHYLGEKGASDIRELQPLSRMKNPYISPIDSDNTYFNKLTNDEKIAINHIGGAVIRKQDYENTDLSEFDFMPANVNSYSSIGLHLAFHVGNVRVETDKEKLHYSFLVTTSRGIFVKTFDARSISQI